MYTCSKSSPYVLLSNSVRVREEAVSCSFCLVRVSVFANGGIFFHVPFSEGVYMFDVGQ